MNALSSAATIAIAAAATTSAARAAPLRVLGAGVEVRIHDQADSLVPGRNAFVGMVKLFAGFMIVVIDVAAVVVRG